MYIRHVRSLSDADILGQLSGFSYSVFFKRFLTALKLHGTVSPNHRLSHGSNSYHLLCSTVYITEKTRTCCVFPHHKHDYTHMQVFMPHFMIKSSCPLNGKWERGGGTVINGCLTLYKLTYVRRGGA